PGNSPAGINAAAGNVFLGVSGISGLQGGSGYTGVPTVTFTTPTVPVQSTTNTDPASANVITNLDLTKFGNLFVGMQVQKLVNNGVTVIPDNTFITAINTGPNPSVGPVLGSTTINQSNVVTNLPSTSGLVPGMLVTGQGIQQNTFISQVLSQTSI